MKNQAQEMLESLANAGFQLRGGFVVRDEVLFGERVLETIHIEAPLCLIDQQLYGFPLTKVGNALRYNVNGVERHGGEGDSFVDYTLELRALAPSVSSYECVVDF